MITKKKKMIATSDLEPCTLPREVAKEILLFSTSLIKLNINKKKKKTERERERERTKLSEIGNSFDILKARNDGCRVAHLIGTKNRKN
jgi:hypothetical protein